MKSPLKQNSEQIPGNPLTLDRGPVPSRQQANALLPRPSCPNRPLWDRGGGGTHSHLRDTPAQGLFPPAAGPRRMGRPVGRGRRGRRTGEGKGGGRSVGRGCPPLVSALWLVGLLCLGCGRPWGRAGWDRGLGVAGRCRAQGGEWPHLWPQHLHAPACTGRSRAVTLGVPWLQVRIPVTPTLTCSPTSSLPSLPPLPPRPLQGHTLLPRQHLPPHLAPVPCRQGAAALGPGLPAGRWEPWSPLTLGAVL